MFYKTGFAGFLISTDLFYGLPLLGSPMKPISAVILTNGEPVYWVALSANFARMAAAFLRLLDFEGNPCRG